MGNRNTKQLGLGRHRKTRHTGGVTPVPEQVFLESEGGIQLFWYPLGEHGVNSAPPRGYAKILVEVLATLLPNQRLNIEARIEMCRQAPRHDGMYFKLQGGIRRDGIYVLLYPPGSDSGGRVSRLTLRDATDHAELYRLLELALKRFDGYRLSFNDFKSLQRTGHDYQEEMPMGQVVRVLIENICLIFMDPEHTGLLRSFSKEGFVQELQRVAAYDGITFSPELRTNQMVNCLAQRGLIQVAGKSQVMIGEEGHIHFMRDMGMLKGTDQEIRIVYEERCRVWKEFMEDAARIRAALEDKLANHTQLVARKQELEAQLAELDQQLDGSTKAVDQSHADLQSWAELYDEETGGSSSSYVRTFLRFPQLEERLRELQFQSA